MKRTLVASSIVFSIVASNLLARESFVSLFDGRTLNGWKVLTCDAEVDAGTILLKAGNGVVHTENRYTDFALELEWKALKPDNWDSGIYFRCELPTAGRPWPNRYQANLRKGLEGNVEGLKGAVSKGLIKPGEWNKFKLTVVGTKASLEINGQPAWEADGVETADGYICLQSEVAGGGQFRFRNIRIANLSQRD
jgi:hypothetical protein